MFKGRKRIISFLWNIGKTRWINRPDIIEQLNEGMASACEGENLNIVTYR